MSRATTLSPTDRQTDIHTYRQTNRQADTQLRCRTASHLLPRLLLSRLASSRPRLQKLTLKACRDQDCQVEPQSSLLHRQTHRQADTQPRCRTASHLPPPTRGTEVYNDQTGTRDQNSGGGLGLERFGLSLSLARLKRLDPRGLETRTVVSTWIRRLKFQSEPIAASDFVS